MRRRVGWIAWVLLGLVGGVTLFAAATPIGRYLARGAWEEGRILSRRRSIADLVADARTPPATRDKLTLVLAARQFAVDSLGLPAHDAFTKFTQLDHDTLVLVLSGTRKDALIPATWWFPVVGRVPYKGFFDFEEGKKEEGRMKDDGYDTYLRPSPAFSTLGWFNDPLLSTTLGADSVFIVETVIHELTHNRLYIAGQAVFNESFAEFAGDRGAVEFFRSRGDTAHARLAEARWRDELRLGRGWERGYAAIDSAFRAHPYAGSGTTPADSAVRRVRLEARDTVYAQLRRFFVDSVSPALETIDRRYGAQVRLDNAALLARRIYATGLGSFEALWDREGRSVRAAIARVAERTAGGGDPYAAIAR